jgi:hypothetical protein
MTAVRTIIRGPKAITLRATFLISIATGDILNRHSSIRFMD